MNLSPMIENVVRFSGYFVCAALALTVPSQAQVYFSPEERTRVIDLWSQPGKYSSGFLPDSADKGTWRVRQTAIGSRWLWQYNRKLRPGKINPLVDPKAMTPKQAAWDAWIDKKTAWDYAQADREAAQKNSAELGRSLAPSEPAVPDPGKAPSDLVEFAGEPPAFAAAVQPQFHKVVFEDGKELIYSDNVPMRRKFQYFRFPEGVQSRGEKVRDLTDGELVSLFEDAGLSKTEMKVMKSVSLLEGGFDSINTYDTGFVSAGFIQFAALEKGAGSLGSVLLRLKTQDYQDFDRHFRRYGIEVTENGELVALCPTSGAEFIGSQAAQKIITDRRLAAVFQYAGRVSRAYRVAQLQVAKKLYYPGDDSLRLVLNGQSETIRVSQVFRTEAGIATLMDRKVNTGSLGSLTQVVQQTVDRLGLDDLSKISLLEFDLVRQMQYRKDYLADASLTRPKDVSADSLRSRAGVARRQSASRSGSRSLRSSGTPRPKPAPAKSSLKSPKSSSKKSTK